MSNILLLLARRKVLVTAIFLESLIGNLSRTHSVMQ